jgi:hypothetical protein
MAKLNWLDEDEEDKSYQEKLEEQTAYYRLIKEEMDNVPDEVTKMFCKAWDRFINECRKNFPEGIIGENDSRRNYPYFNLFLTIFIRKMNHGQQLRYYKDGEDSNW